MPRRNLVDRELETIERSIERKLAASPLAIIAQLLLDLITGTRSSVAAGSISAVQARSVGTSVNEMLDALPSSFGHRFLFDTALIQSFAEEWGHGGIRLSNMIVPRHSKEWGHLTVPMPSPTGCPAHVVDVILVPGDDDITAVDLLDYPWIGHELGHNLHFRANYFADRFAPRLRERLMELQALAVADRGATKQKSIAAANMIRRVWWPSRDHKNWAHEIAVDIVALWTCGPAFLCAFDDFIDRHDPAPFHINQVHPPYHLRVLALVDAASRLGWAEFTATLQQRLQSWSCRLPTSYEYVTLSDDDLLMAAVTCGLQACDDFGLPRLTIERRNELQRAIGGGTVPEFGSELVVAAWLAEKEFNQPEFDEWHKTTVLQLAESVTLESPQ